MAGNYLLNLGPFTAVGRSVRSCHDMRGAFTVATVNSPKILPEFQVEFAQSIAEALNERNRLRAACQMALDGLSNMFTEQFQRGEDKPIRDCLAAALAQPNAAKPSPVAPGEQGGDR